MRCQARTTKGTRCKNKATRESNYCRLHARRITETEQPRHELIFTDALYYPYIEIPNEEWLKTASLYWNSLSTIVPRSMHVYRSSTAAVLQDAGVLHPLVVHPDMQELQGIAEEVLEYLDTQEGQRALLSFADIPVSRIHKDKLSNQLYRELTGTFRLHSDKMTRELFRRVIRQSGRRRSRKPWIEVSEAFALYYMTLLASRLSRAKGRALLTEEITAESLASRASLGSTIPRRPSEVPAEIAEGLLATLALKTISIGPGTPVSRILGFREKHETELAKFRSAIRQLIGKLTGPINIDALSSHIQSLYTDEVMPSLEDLRGRLRDHRITCGLTNLKLSTLAPASPTAVGFVLSQVGWSPLALVSGIGLSIALQTVNYRIQRRDILRQSPFSYILLAERRLGRRKR